MPQTTEFFKMYIVYFRFLNVPSLKGFKRLQDCVWISFQLILLLKEKYGLTIFNPLLQKT